MELILFDLLTFVFFNTEMSADAGFRDRLRKSWSAIFVFGYSEGCAKSLERTDEVFLRQVFKVQF